MYKCTRTAPHTIPRMRLSFVLASVANAAYYIFETVTVSFATLNDKYVHCVSVGWYSDPVPVLQMATVKVARRRMITKRHV
jgi:hypothetical protein